LNKTILIEHDFILLLFGANATLSRRF